MSRHCYYNGGYNNTCEVDHHRYEEIPDIDPSMDFLVQTDDSSAFYYMESPTRLPVDESVDDPAERSLLLRAVQQQQQQHNRHQQPPPQPPNRGRRATPPSAGERPGPNNNRAAVTPCKARRRLDVVYGAAGTVSLPSTPPPPSANVVFAPVTAADASTFAARTPVAATVRRARSSAALYNRHRRPPEFLSEYNLDTCVPATGVQYDRPRNTAVIQPIYKAPSSVFQVLWSCINLFHVHVRQPPCI